MTELKKKTSVIDPMACVEQAGEAIYSSFAPYRA